MLILTLSFSFCLMYNFCKSGRRRIGCLRDSHIWKEEVTKEANKEATKEATKGATKEANKEDTREAPKKPNRQLTKGGNRLVIRVLAVLSLQFRAW